MYSGAIPLTNQIKPDVQIYFTDIRDVCKGAIKQIQQVQQVAEFQKGHKQRLAMFRKHQKVSACCQRERTTEEIYNVTGIPTKRCD